MKRILSLIIAVSMLISLIPVVSATSDISEGITIKYDLSAHLAELGLTRDATNIDGPAETTPAPSDIDALTHGLFKFSNTSRYSAWNKNFYATNGYGGGIAHNIVFRNYVSFEVSVPVSDTYKMQVSHGTHYLGGNVTVYITEGDFEKGKHKDKGTALGTYSAYIDKNASPELTTYRTLITSKVLTSSGDDASYVFEAGKKYTVTFDGPTATYYGSVGSFSLIAGNDAIPIDVDITGSDTYRLKAKVYMSDGSINSNAEVVWSGYDTEVISVLEDGSVSVLRDGETPLTVTVTMGDFTVTKTETVSFKAPLLPNKTITYDIASRMGDTGDTSTLFTDFTYETNNNLWEYAANRRSSYSYAVDYFDDDPETNPAVNTAVTSGSHLVYMYGKGMQIRAGQNNWWAIKIRVDEAGLYVPKVTYGTYENDSAYKLNGNYVTDKDGELVIVYPESYLDYYLIPVDENVSVKETLVEANLNSETLIGTVACTDPDSADKMMRTKAFEKINFAAGEYYIVFRPYHVSPITEAGSVSFASAILTLAGNITLDGINSIKELEATVDKTELSYTGDEVATAQIRIKVSKLNGMPPTPEELQITYTSSDEDVVHVDENGLVTAVGDGGANVTVSVTDGRETLSEVISFTACDKTGIASTEHNLVDKMYVREKKLPRIWVKTNRGNRIELPISAEGISLEMLEGENIAHIEDGMIAVTNTGSFKVTLSTALYGENVTTSIDVTTELDTGTTDPSYYTYEMRENARKNIEKYDWAKKIKKSAVATADKLLSQVDIWFERIHGEGIPRTRQIGERGDLHMMYCRYCHANVGRTYVVDPVNRPWKIQCPDCKRLFPSNDFGSFYELGRDALGRFDITRARQKHHEMLFHTDGSECTCEAPAAERSPEWYIFYGYGNPNGFLYNDMYSEIRDSNTDPWGDIVKWKDGWGSNLGEYRDPETGELLWSGGDMWAVDDGWGYFSGRKYDDGTGLSEHCSYVSFYCLSFWNSVSSTLKTLSDAYLYTGDVKYGRPAALLLDRLADVLPEFDCFQYKDKGYYVTGQGTFSGVFQGSINDTYIIRDILYSADILKPMIYDTTLIRQLSENAKVFENEISDKTSSEEIYNYWVDRIILESAWMPMEGRVGGNFGQAQEIAALGAIVLNKQPETDEILEWLFKKENLPYPYNFRSGGDLQNIFFDRVDRDGMGDEASPRYNGSWVNNLMTTANALTRYTGDNDYNIYKNPKFMKMFLPHIDIMLTGNKQPNIGDSGATASVTNSMGSASTYLDAFNATDNEYYKKRFAEYIYKLCGGDLKGLAYEIFSENPEGAEKDIMAYVDESKPFGEGSLMLTGYGLAILRDGAKYDSASASTENDTQRDFWMWFGNTSVSHAHEDALDIGIDAFGLDVAPDLGYPEDTSYSPNRLQWVDATISHNTVVVDEKSQSYPKKIHGDPYHFDDSGKVKLMDADMKEVYPQTENYRRTVVMVQASDDVSYGVDFFRVTGGSHHLFSFHSQAENAYPIDGLTMIPDPVVQDENGNDIVGTYQGPEVPYGNDPNTVDSWVYDTFYPRGYTWLKNVRRDSAPESNRFTVEFDVQDYNNVTSNGSRVNLRMTQINNFTPTEVAIAGGHTPQKAETVKLPKTLDYVLVERDGEAGESLDSLFTTIYEPYRDNPYIKSVDAVEIVAKEEDAHLPGDAAQAVKVVRTNGGIEYTDYVVYATNNDIVYTVDGLFDFCGFVGVYTLNSNGGIIYRYVNDGTVIGEETGKPREYTGTVVSFQKENSFDNYIDVNIDCGDLADLADRYIYVDNDGVENGVYRIVSVASDAESALEICADAPLAEGTVRLDLGTVALIRGYKNKEDIAQGYVYNIKEGQTFSIPTSFVDQSLPEFEPVSDSLSTSAGSSIKVTVKATSPIEIDAPSITYIGATLPRGASLNSESGVLTWKPDSSQVGDNHIAITARDSDGRESTIHFDISVYGSTTSDSTENKTEIPSTESSGTSAGGGGGSGGDAPTDKLDNTANTNKSDTSDEADNGDASTQTNVVNGIYDVPQFTDLTNHTWAADAINALTVDGIIKGTSATTFSPANNITRADFALLLVRAFKLESDSTENFADISADDYFASEVAIARNNGIINGIGDNKFAPRNTITRQDMMTIVYRAMTKLGVELKKTTDAEMPDADLVAEYAKEAVEALIGAGLVNGKSGNIAPSDYTTRAEVAVLLNRILEYTK